MSFRAYLDTIEDKTGLTPRELLARAQQQGFDATTKATPIVHRDESTELWIDGKATKPQS